MYPPPRPLPLSELPAAIRQQAEFLVRFAPEVAEGLVYCAEWFEVCLADGQDARLSLAEAADESGWSYEGLRRRLAEVPELNAGEPGAPLIRRRDLQKLGAPRGPRAAYGPRKPKAGAPASPASEAPVPSSATSTHDARFNDAAKGREPLEIARPGVGAADGESLSPDGVEGVPEAETRIRRENRMRRRRAGAAGHRKESADQRFGELLALAATG